MVISSNDPVLTHIGSKVRRLRGARGWTRKELASRTGLSERFLAQVESGRGNPSVLSLSDIAAALQTSASELLAVPQRSELAALLGLRGAGKSTVGQALAERLEVPFIELDALVEEAAGLSLGEIFEIHGEDYYRTLEREALLEVIASGPRSVLATGGGLVTHTETFKLLRSSATTIWLKASPEDHWNRVVQQGDHRPMANDPLAMAHLRELLAQREDLYRTADHIVETSQHSVADIVDAIIRLRVFPPVETKGRNHVGQAENRGGSDRGHEIEGRSPAQRPQDGEGADHGGRGRPEGTQRARRRAGR